MKLLVLLLAAIVVVRADLYVQNPPGSNDRNRERNDNRNNANRMFDSQNNAAGGYPWRGDATSTTADPITYYHGSKLRIEWTNQHACGPNPNIACQLIIQYTCQDANQALRDGYPEGNIVDSDNNAAEAGTYKRRAFSGRGGQDQDGVQRIPDNNDPAFYDPGLAGGIEFGYHETIASYKLCTNTLRNKGLYTSDQKLNGDAAIYTRQNPNGGRRGLECPEERDYYPYWRPTMWKDVAVLVNDIKYCDYYQSKSENIVPRSYCQCSQTCQNAAPSQKIPIDAANCAKFGGSWLTATANNLPAPACQVHAYARDNHLGNVFNTNSDGSLQGAVDQPEMANYVWEVPPVIGSQDCILRVRYNMSTNDYPAMAFAEPGAQGVGFDASKSCPKITSGANDNTGVDDATGTVSANPQCESRLTATSRPLYNRPYVKIFAGNYPALSLAINTHQTGRTFQDRTYVFRVAPRPDGVSGTVWNLNVRGRRGNIVQAYPANEYDFVPDILHLGNGDWVHIQIHGSDYNEAKNANNGEGWRFSDRSNIVQTESNAINYPLFQDAGDSRNMFQSLDIARRWALLEQDPALCKAYKDGDPNEQNQIDNCGKLNRAPARFPKNADTGLVKFTSAGTFRYMSSRNNNFSNRSQKAYITVDATGLSAAAIAGIVVGSIAGAGLLFAGVLFYGKRNPNTVAGSLYSKTAGRCTRGGGASTYSGSTPKSGAPAPDMEYTRH